MSIACSGYNHLKELVFISKNSSTSRDYDFNVYNSDQTKKFSLPLSSISNFPNATEYSFGGLCTYASSSSSIYLSFDSISAPKNNTSVIYSLQLLNNGTQLFQAVGSLPPDARLSSLVYLADTNKTAGLAYIATSTTSNRTSLNLVRLNTSIEHYAMAHISETGILAAGSPEAQILYFIQDSTINEYRLDKRQYSQSEIRTNLNSVGLTNATTGQVMLSSNGTMAYISIYHPETRKLHLINHNLALTNYTDLITDKQDNITLVFKSRASKSKSNLSHLSGQDESRIDESPSPSSSPTPSTDHLSKDRKLPKSEIRSNTIHKRAVEIDDSNSQTSSDSAYYYHSGQVVNKAGDPFPMAAVLVPSSNDNQSPPYDYTFISYNDSQGFMVTTENGSPSILETPFPSDAAANSSPGQLSGGAIAGIVIGVIAFVAIIAGLLFYAARKRKERKRNYGTREITTRSFKAEDFLAPYIESPKEKNEDNHSHTSSILQEATSIPEEYHDGSRPDIRPLSYSGDSIDYANLSSEELLQLEPDINGPLFLFSGLYTSSADERVTYLKDGYAVRAFDASNGTKHTVHYFSAAHLDTFVRSVFTAIRISKTKDGKPQTYVISSERAIVLSTPTPHFNYQYIWITSPVIPEHSLHHLLFEKNRWSFIDYNNVDYKIWSIYSILRSLEALHSHKFVHLAIDLRSFYFDHELKATDWRLGNFEYAHSLKRRGTTRSKRVLPPSSPFTAPEIINEQGEITLPNIDEEKLDIWSLGCVIYTVATGGLLLFEDDKLVKNLITFNDDMRQHVRIAIRDNVDNAIFQTLLEKMLQVHSSDRKNIKELLDYWNSIYNMEE